MPPKRGFRQGREKVWSRGGVNAFVGVASGLYRSICLFHFCCRQRTARETGVDPASVSPEIATESKRPPVTAGVHRLSEIEHFVAG